MLHNCGDVGATSNYGPRDHIVLTRGRGDTVAHSKWLFLGAGTTQQSRGQKRTEYRFGWARSLSSPPHLYHSAARPFFRVLFFFFFSRALEPPEPGAILLLVFKMNDFVCPNAFHLFQIVGLPFKVTLLTSQYFVFWVKPPPSEWKKKSQCTFTVAYICLGVHSTPFLAKNIFSERRWNP